LRCLWSGRSQLWRNKTNNSRKFYTCIQSRQSLIPYYVGMNPIVGKPLQIHNTYMWEKKLQKKDPRQISCERKKQKKKKNKQTTIHIALGVELVMCEPFQSILSDCQERAFYYVRISCFSSCSSFLNFYTAWETSKTNARTDSSTVSCQIGAN